MVMVRKFYVAQAQRRSIQSRHLDFADLQSMALATQDVECVRFISSDNMGGRVDPHKRAARGMVASGVKRILYTSYQALGRSIAVCVSEHGATEKAIAASDVAGYTFMRNGLYHENNLPFQALALKTGKCVTAAPPHTLSGSN